MPIEQLRPALVAGTVLVAAAVTAASAIAFAAPGQFVAAGKSDRLDRSGSLLPVRAEKAPSDDCLPACGSVVLKADGDRPSVVLRGERLDVRQALR